MGEIVSLEDERLRRVLADAPVSSADFKNALAQATIEHLQRALVSVISEEFPHGEPGHKGRVHLIRKRINKLSNQ